MEEICPTSERLKQGQTKPTPNIAGMRFGRWIAIRLITIKGGAKWLCRCDCGTDKIVKWGNLQQGKTRSCGCYRKDKTTERNTTHKMSRTAIYAVWCAMIARCKKPQDKAWKNYGGRGIFVSEDWLSFNNFIRDMGECPNGLTLDRINNDGPYSKENCRWTTRTINNRNTRKSKRKEEILWRNCL